MPDPDDRTPSPSLDALEAKIAAIRARRAPPKTGMAARGFKGVELAWRMVIDLSAGIAVGLAIGWGIDVLAGTKPFFMIVFVLLGFASGIRIMLQSAGTLQRRKTVEPGAAPADDNKAGAPSTPPASGAETPEREDG